MFLNPILGEGGGKFALPLLVSFYTAKNPLGAESSNLVTFGLTCKATFQIDFNHLGVKVLPW